MKVIDTLAIIYVTDLARLGNILILPNPTMFNLEHFAHPCYNMAAQARLRPKLASEGMGKYKKRSI